jgi:RimJ/RimL family protein N-acetyltransferase
MTAYIEPVTAYVDWPGPEPIETGRLVLEPLRVDHADEMAAVLNDQSLHTFIGGQPATREELRRRYAIMAAGDSPDGQQGWLNWVVRHRPTGEAVGTVQATLTRSENGHVAELAWVTGAAYQRRGYASEAAIAMAQWLRRHGVETLIAHVNPAHLASNMVATRLGMRATDVSVDGETRWST